MKPAMRVSLALALLPLLAAACGAHNLKLNYYAASCPGVEEVVLKHVMAAVLQDFHSVPPLLRLLFHDCAVQGCDASVLLDKVGKAETEKSTEPNLTLDGFAIIDAIKAELEAQCPGVVSCADIIALAARDAVKVARGPVIPVKLGRRDGRMPHNADANLSNLPSSRANVSTLLASFAQHGLGAKDLVALSGAHTFGRARCVRLIARFPPFEDPTIDPMYMKKLFKHCKAPAIDFETETELDPSSPFKFDNQYYKNLLAGLGTLMADSNLVGDRRTSVWVKKFAKQGQAFFFEFTQSFIKLSEVQVLETPQGEIRRVCSKPN